MDTESMNRTATTPAHASLDDAYRCRVFAAPAVSHERGILSRVVERGGAVESNDQLGLDFEVEQTAWGKWVDPDRRAAQVRKFLDYAGLERIPSEPWPEGSPEVKRLDAVLAEWIPDMDTAMQPENHDMIDALVCFMGECFIRFAGAHWIDWQSWDDEYSFYDHVNPAVECDTPDQDELGMWVLVKDMRKYDPEVDAGMFSYFTSTLREYSGYHDDKRREATSSTE